MSTVLERMTVMVMRYDEPSGVVGALWEIAPGQYEQTVGMLTRIFGQPPAASGMAPSEGLAAAAKVAGWAIVHHDR